MTRKLIVERQEYLFKKDFMGTFDGVIKNLTKIKEEYEEEYPTTDYTITIEYSYDYDGNHMDSAYYVKITRLENDEEYKARIKREKNEKNVKIERDRIEYERLKKLFGDLK